MLWCQLLHKKEAVEEDEFGNKMSLRKFGFLEEQEAAVARSRHTSTTGRAASGSTTGDPAFGVFSTCWCGPPPRLCCRVQTFSPAAQPII